MRHEPSRPAVRVPRKRARRRPEECAEVWFENKAEAEAIEQAAHQALEATAELPTDD